MFVSLGRFSLGIKVALLGGAGVLVSTVALVVLAVWLSGQYHNLARNEVESLINTDLDHITQSTYNLIEAEYQAAQKQAAHDLNLTRHLVGLAGGVRLGQETVGWKAINQSTGATAEITLPKLLLGETELAPNSDPLRKTPVVDEVERLCGSSCTIFQRVNDAGDMLRAATTVRTAEGRRAIGTMIAATEANGSPNPVIAAIQRGERYYGRAFVVNQWYITAYEPILNETGSLIGMLYAGIPQSKIEELVRRVVLQTTIGKTGYVYVVGGKDAHRGRYIISQHGERDGEDVWDTRDCDGEYIIRSIVRKALSLPAGDLGTWRYRWQNPQEPEPRWKIARIAYYEPSDWVIGTSVYEDELKEYQLLLSEGRRNMADSMLLAGALIMLLLGAAGWWAAQRIVRPVRQLTQALEKVAQGDLNYAVPTLSGGGEIGRLSQALTAMTGQLKETLLGLQKSEASFRLIFNHAIEGIFQTSLEGKMLNASPSLARILRFDSPEEMVRTLTDVRQQLYANPEERTEVLRELRQNGSIIGRELRLKMKDGEVIWTSFTAKLVEDLSTRTSYIQGFIFDITARRLAEKAARQSSQRLEQIVNFLPDATFAIDRDGKVILWNHAIERLLGIQADQMLGRDNFEYAIPMYGRRQPILADIILNSQFKLEHNYDRFQREGDSLMAESELVIRGERRIVWGKAVPLYDEAGEKIGAIESLRDLTLYRDTDEAVRSLQRQQQQQIIEFQPDATFAIDRAGKVIAWNHAIEEMTGIPAVQMLGKDNYEYALPFYGERRPILIDLIFLDAPGCAEKYTYVRREGSAIVAETTLTIREKLIHLWGKAVPLYDHKGDLVGAIEAIRDITAQRRAEAALQHQAHDLQLMLENMLNAFVVWQMIRDPEGHVRSIRFDYFNSTYAQLSKLQLEQVKGKDVFEVWPNTEDEWIQIYREVVTTGIPRTFEQYHAATSGWYHCNAYRPDETSDRVCVIFEDISERRQTEALIHDTAERLTFTVDAAQLGTFDYHPQEGITHWNKQAGRMWGMAVGELVDFEQAMQHIHPDDYERVKSAIQLAMTPSSDGILEVEFRIVWTDGSIHWNLAKGKVHFEGEGSARHAVRMTGIHLDITDRKAAELALRENELKFQTLIETTETGYVRIDGKGCVIDANAEYVRLSGHRELAEIQHHSVLEWTAECAREKNEAALRACMTEGIIRNLEIDYVSADGSVTPVEINATVITSGGEPEVLTLCRDISQRRALEQRLRQSEKMDAIGQLAGGVAHDFNNMLGGIMGAADLLTPYVETDVRGKQFLDLILGATQRAAELTSQLLTFSRKGMTAATDLDVHKPLHDALTLIARTIDKRIRISATLPAQEHHIAGDHAQLQNAFLNILINAANAMPDGGDIYVSSRSVEIDGDYCQSSSFHIQPGNYVNIEIRDTGCGIPPENLPHIFEPFFTTKELGKGTGLGLSAVFGTMQQHKGAINVYSEVGKGTSIHLLFPLIVDRPAAATEAPRTDLIYGTGLVLVIDDEDMMRTTAGGMLQKLGYRVLTASNGVEGLRCYRESSDRIDLVILDMIMPEMNGRDCFMALKKLNPEARVILSSGFTREEDMAAMKELGLKGFIRKPFRTAELSQVIHQALNDDNA